MAMRHSRRAVFGGAVAALAVMTALSAAIGAAAPALIPAAWTHFAAVGLFLFFGAKTLWGALRGGGGGEGGGEGGEPSELEEVERELADGRASRDRLSAYRGASPTASKRGGRGGAGKGKAKDAGGGLMWRLGHLAALLVSPAFLNALSLTFVAEWGDRSQIATIGLAASSSALGVTLGAILGHAACTAAAVIGGRHLARHIDERTVALAGGALFLVFGLHALWEGPQ